MIHNNYALIMILFLLGGDAALFNKQDGLQILFSEYPRQTIFSMDTWGASFISIRVAVRCCFVSCLV